MGARWQSTVVLTAGSIYINSIDAVSYGEAFTDIQFIMSDCNDEIYTKSTYDSASSVGILGNVGSNVIELGDSMN